MHKPITVTLNQLQLAGLLIAQHRTHPQPDAWYVGLAPTGGELGPFETPEQALLEGIAWLKRTLAEYRELSLGNALAEAERGGASTAGSVAAERTRECVG